jgi:hypothetical protein
LGQRPVRKRPGFCGEAVDLPLPGHGEQLYEVSSARINYADTHQALSRKVDQRHSVMAR